MFNFFNFKNISIKISTKKTFSPRGGGQAQAPKYAPAYDDIYGELLLTYNLFWLLCCITQLYTPSLMPSKQHFRTSVMLVGIWSYIIRERRLGARRGDWNQGYAHCPERAALKDHWYDTEYQSYRKKNKIGYLLFGPWLKEIKENRKTEITSSYMAQPPPGVLNATAMLIARQPARCPLSPIHTADADETKLSSLVASASAVCTWTRN